MARSRSHNSAALPPPLPAPRPKRTPDDEGWRRPWVPWAVGGGLLAAGMLIGWLAPMLALRSHMPAPVPARGSVKAVPSGARVVGAPEVDAAPGEQLELTWQVTNTGIGVWETHAYRFMPVQGEGAPVISLPFEVAPWTTEPVTLKTRVTAPAQAGTWQPVWELRGPAGPVPGGRLTATVRVLADRAQPAPPTPEPPAAPFPPSNAPTAELPPPDPLPPQPPQPEPQPNPQPDPQPNPNPNPQPEPEPQPNPEP
ncbi:MAG TPA: hypothetical protein VNT75_19780 [Symbiobacteriaceae bacterium]|nr:hypothetical protein [Symbiobacteriaceae bacterium]